MQMKNSRSTTSLNEIPADADVGPRGSTTSLNVPALQRANSTSSLPQKKNGTPAPAKSKGSIRSLFGYVHCAKFYLRDSAW